MNSIQGSNEQGSSSQPTLELKTKVEIDKSMKLIDINGKKISFQSDCFIKPNNPNDTFYVAIVNQNDLDQGAINFDIFDQAKEGITYKRRITYESQDGEHLNHYIALKKLPKNMTEQTIQAEVIVRLTELQSQPQMQQPQMQQPQMQQQLYSPLNIQHDNNESNESNESDLVDQKLIDENPETVEELKQKLFELSQSKEYNNKYNNNDNYSKKDFYKKIGIVCLIVVVLYVLLRKK